jgi:hypothetical protein
MKQLLLIATSFGALAGTAPPRSGRNPAECRGAAPDIDKSITTCSTCGRGGERMRYERFRAIGDRHGKLIEFHRHQFRRPAELAQ